MSVYSTPGAPLEHPAFIGRVTLPVYTVATVPAVLPAGGAIVVSNSHPTAHAICISNGTNWVDQTTGATVAVAG